MNLKVIIYDRGHPDGHPTECFWELRSSGELIDCGHANGFIYAAEDAETALIKARDGK